MFSPNRLRLWWLWQKLKRQVRDQFRPEHAQDWIEVGMLLVTTAMLIANYLRFWWTFSEIFGPK